MIDKCVDGLFRIKLVLFFDSYDRSLGWKINKDILCAGLLRENLFHFRATTLGAHHVRDAEFHDLGASLLVGGPSQVCLRNGRLGSLFAATNDQTNENNQECESTHDDFLSLHYRQLATTGNSSGFSAAMARISSVIFIEQYFGPHMLQKWALLKVSAGKV